MRKILIVEDDTLLNRTLGYNLASDGYEITAAYNHKDAVSHLKETEFDVALLDINLPDGSGLDLCEEIRGRGQHTYIIFITANDKESDMLKGYEAGGARLHSLRQNLPQNRALGPRASHTILG